MHPLHERLARLALTTGGRYTKEELLALAAASGMLSPWVGVSGIVG